MLKTSKRESGIIAIVPVLIIAAILVLGISASAFKKGVATSNQDKAVLSESSSGGGDNGSSGGSDGGSHGSSGGSSTSGSGSSSGSSGSGGGGSNAVITTVKAEKVETPEPRQVELKTSDVETEDGLDTETEFEVKEGSDEAKTKITIGKNAGAFSIKESQFQAQSDFPLSVNKTTDQLTASTSAGVKVVAVLPDQAVQNMIKAGILSQVSTNSQGQNNIKITTDANGNVIYEINGVKYEKFLGLVNVAIDKTGQVSASNGQLVGVNQSFFSTLLDGLSF